MNKIIRYSIGIILMGFGLLTLFLSTSVIFDLFGIRAKEGNYVLFIVWSNFIASLFYLTAAYGFFTKQKWITKILVLTSIILLVAFIGLNIHINAGGIYELKTFRAMIFRTGVTVLFAISSYFIINKNKLV